MQGQRGTIGSLSEALEFDCGSTSSNATVDQHIFGNNLRNPTENRMPDYILSPSDMNPSYMNSINHEWQNLSGWSLGEPSSSNTQNEVNNNEQKRELGLSSSINAGAIAGPRLEERHFEPTNAFSLDNVNTSPMYMCNSNSHLVSQNLNLNAGLTDSGGHNNSYHVEHPNLHKSSGPVNEHIPPTIGSGSFLLPSGSNSIFVEDTDRSGCSLDTRRVSCKRKAVGEKPVFNLTLSGIKYLSPECSVSKANDSDGTQKESKTAATCSTSEAIDNVSKSASDPERMLNPEGVNSIASVLARDDSPEQRDLNKPLLQSLLKGDHPELAFLLRQLLIASSSLLRLNLQKDDSSLPSSFVPALIEISQVLLLEFTEMVVVPQQSTFLLLDGVLSYLRELASYFPFTDPTSSRKVYTKLIQIHMRAMGKTILLQGKRATLTFHERQSCTKTLHKGSFEACSSNELYCFCLDEFKTSLRGSFKAYIERQSELHLLSTIQAIERALVGVQEGCTMIYGIKTSKEGGEISSLVAAGIDCFDMIIEFVSGRKSLKLIKRHCQSLVAAVFNIIVHLQSPLIFYVNLTSRTVASTPDPGSAILMCVEVLVTVSRKHAIFSMDVWHVGHLLHIPAVLFQNFHQLRFSKASGSSDSFVTSEEQNSHPAERENLRHIDHQFSINLFVACCQLLCTIIRHRPSECKQCVPHLEASVAVLLNCLETVLDSKSMVNKGCFSWEVEEGVKCACFLRRIYEEIKQQKDIFGRHVSLFLSNYIWVYSGYGPKRSGIRREIDEALRPGVFALIDACSVDDLQYLHTVFGEGPCRNTLATLQHDYKLNFKFEGKV